MIRKDIAKLERLAIEIDVLESSAVLGDVSDARKSVLRGGSSRAERRSPSDRAALSTARATWAIVLLTLGNIAISVSQYFVFSDQLAEMRTSREGGEESTRSQLAIMNKQANEARRQADMIDGSQRPWIWPQIYLNGPITFESGDAYINIDIKYRNTGHLPALSVRADVTVYPWMTRNTLFEDTPKKQRDRDCRMGKIVQETQAKRPSELVDGGSAVFPGQTFVEIQPKKIPKKFIDDAKGAVSDSTGIIIAVTGCVFYRYPGDQKIHQTGFVKRISLINAGNAFVTGLIPIDQGPIDAKRLYLDDVESGPAD